MGDSTLIEERIGFKKVNGVKKTRCNAKVGAVRVIDGPQLEWQNHAAVFKAPA